jgi:type II secretory pathway predicted ATPase ExeA
MNIMSHELKMYFDLKKDPFSSNLGVKELMEPQALSRVKKRIDYLGVMVITGDVGAGKSRGLRWAINQYHPSEHHIISIIATSGSPTELYPQISWELGLNIPNGRIATMQKEIRAAIKDIATVKRQKVLIVIDEASLLRSDLLSEIHTLSQYDYDSKLHLSMILCGQTWARC